MTRNNPHTTKPSFEPAAGATHQSEQVGQEAAHVLPDVLDQVLHLGQQLRGQAGRQG